MLLDTLPVEIVREILLGLSTVDLIKAVKCNNRIYQIVHRDIILRSRLISISVKFFLSVNNSYTCYECSKIKGPLELTMKGWNGNGTVLWENIQFTFWDDGQCDSRKENNVTMRPDDLVDIPSIYYYLCKNDIAEDFEFVVVHGSMDEAITSCGKFIYYLMKSCVVRNFSLDISHKLTIWHKLAAFFKENPPDVHVRPEVGVCGVKLNIDEFMSCCLFSNGLNEIALDTGANGDMNVSNWYHDVFRKTPFVNFHCLENLPYTYEDLFGIFKDTKRLRLTNSHMITDEQVCKIVQDFYEGKHDEDYIFEIGVGGENVKVEDYLKLIPKEAYRLKVIRKRSFDSSYEMKTWAKMTDRFGRKWALVDMTIHDEMDEGNLRIYNMKYSGVRHCGWGFCS